MNLTTLGNHGCMLADNQRNRALEAGIVAAVQEGDVVIDIGAGTAFLSMIAARAGARKVYAVEAGAMVSVADRLIRCNGYSNQIEIHKCSSFEFTPPEPADVILCETLGVVGFDEGFRPMIIDARERMLRPHGRLLPASVELIAAPVTQPADLWDVTQLDTILGFDFSGLAEVFRKIYRRCFVAYDSELASPRPILRVNCYDAERDSPLNGAVEYVIERAGTLAGFGVWFEARLSHGALLSSRRTEPDNHWRQAFLPVSRPVPVCPGQRITAHFRLDDRAARFRFEWNAECAGDKAALPA